MVYGHALTIDASQGNTSRIHMDVILSGSWLHQGGKGYVNESLQTETTLMFVNEATERRKISSQMPRGEVIRLISLLTFGGMWPATWIARPPRPRLAIS